MGGHNIALVARYIIEAFGSLRSFRPFVSRASVSALQYLSHFGHFLQLAIIHLHPSDEDQAQKSYSRTPISAQSKSVYTIVAIYQSCSYRMSQQLRL